MGYRRPGSESSHEVEDFLVQKLREFGVSNVKKDPVEGFYFGFTAFIGNIARALMSFLFSIVHILTGFVEGADIQTPLANFGILLLMGVIPAIIMCIGLVIFAKFYDITLEKSKSIKEKLAELKI